jgi:asparagine synthase (glutamine-hydrolysing)
MRAAGNDAGYVLAADSRLVRLRSLQRNRARRAETLNLMRALYGLDQWAPLLDLRLVDFCLAIPEDQYLRGGTSRWLARRLLRTAGAPRAVSENRLRGRQHPEWFGHLARSHASLPAQIDRLRRSPTASRLIDLERLDHVLGAWPSDAVTAERHRVTLQTLLAEALSAGAFIAWAEGTN